MRTKILIALCFLFTFSCDLPLHAAAVFSHVQAFFDQYGEMADHGDYSVYVVDSTAMDGLSASTTAGVLDWAVANYGTAETPVSGDAVVARLSAGGKNGSELGFVADGLAMNGAAEAYFVIAYCAADNGKEYLDVIASDWSYPHAYNINFDASVPAANATGWQLVPEPVPEPTGAFMLLLGIAGLALRRNRTRPGA